MKKRGQGLPLNVIIIAIIVLIVVIVLIALFGSKITTFRQGTSSCEQQGGTCKPQCDPTKESYLPSFECTEQKVCCIGLIGETDDG
jgi:hypothetical protein